MMMKIASGVATVSECASLVAAIVKLAAEIAGSKKMCAPLADYIKKLQPYVEKAVQCQPKGEHQRLLEEFQSFLVEVHGFLENHAKSNFFERVTNHWKMKDCVIQYVLRLDQIKTLLAFSGEAQLHEQTDLLHLLQEISIQANADMADNMKELKDQLDKMPQAIVAMLRQEGFASLADLQHEIQYNSVQYSTSQVKSMGQLLHRAYKVIKLVDFHASVNLFSALWRSTKG